MKRGIRSEKQICFPDKNVKSETPKKTKKHKSPKSIRT
jgi:hypothetical protein